jgi:hypothetical protein
MKKLKFNKQRVMAIVGLFVTIFTIIGIVSTVKFAINTTIDIVDKKAQKQVFNDFLFPLVMLDPPSFERLPSLDHKTLLTSAIWNIVINDKNKYKVDEYDMMIIPATDVEASAIKMYGKGLTFKHQTLGDGDFLFNYNSENKTYFVPVTPNFLPKAPRVDKISKSGSIYTLTVSYISTSNLWSLSGKTINIKDIVKNKVVEFKVIKSDKNAYKIISMKVIQSGGIAEPNDDTSVPSTPASTSEQEETSQENNVTG